MPRNTSSTSPTDLKDEVTQSPPLDPAAASGETALATQRPAQVPAAAFAGDDTGFEDFGAGDLAIPFLVVLQKGSPQVEEERDVYIPGAKAGMLMNSVTSQLYEGRERGVYFIPAHRVHEYLEWIPRDEGGGLVGRHEPLARAVKEAMARAGTTFGKLPSADGNELQETFTMYGLFAPVPEGETSFTMAAADQYDWQPVAMGYASTFIGVYKKWMTTAMNLKFRNGAGVLQPYPLNAHVYRVTTQFFQKKDNTWYKPRVTFSVPQMTNGREDLLKSAEASRLPEDALAYRAAAKLRHDVKAGLATANPEQLQGHDGGGAAEDDERM